MVASVNKIPCLHVFTATTLLKLSQIIYSSWFQFYLDLTFEEAARGVNKSVKMNVVDECPKCYGRKAEPGSSAETCPQCNGTGMVSKQNYYCCFINIRQMPQIFKDFLVELIQEIKKCNFLLHVLIGSLATSSQSM